MFCTLFGIWCAVVQPVSLQPISSFVVMDRAMHPLFMRVEFVWNPPCPLDQTKDATIVLQGSADILNSIQKNLPVFVHGMTPNWKMREGTTMQFNNDCTYIMGNSGTTGGVCLGC